jgi:hypothetical protein
MAMVALVSMLNQIIFPTMALALTGGPSQPEFSSFEPVSATNMVNEFTGDFTYNVPVIEVPGPAGSGYAMSLSYHSGARPEEEASWVGYGFSLNAGAINRIKRGLPDDINGEKNIKYNLRPKNWTATLGIGATVEILSKDIPVRVGASIRYNNYVGFGYNKSIGMAFGKGAHSVHLGINKNDGSSYSISASVASKIKLKGKSKLLNKFKIKSLHLKTENLGMHTFEGQAASPHADVSDGVSVNLTGGILATPAPFPAGFQPYVQGSYSERIYEGVQALDSYGYLYSGNASGNDVLMDYSVHKEAPFNKRDLYLGVPATGADIYSVSGEGVGGAFRAYQKKIGQFYPNKTVSTMVIENIGVEFEAGMDIGGGGDLGVGANILTQGPWKKNLSSFSAYTGNTEDEDPFVFAFNGDMAGVWEHEDDGRAISAKIKYRKPQLDGIETTMNRGNTRERSNYIRHNLNKNMGSSHIVERLTHRSDLLEGHFNRSSEGFADGIGAFGVLSSNGTEYVYGLPVYQKMEKSISYDVLGVGKVENRYQAYFRGRKFKTKIGQSFAAPYATSYLLTDILSPEYIDLSLDGPTPDDFGGYTRFNYTQVYGEATGNHYHWRAPYTGVLYNRGELSNSYDDMGSVSEGDKEIKYLQSIETKTHAAIFETEGRLDGIDAVDSDEDFSKELKGNNRLKRLKAIHLYLLEDLKRDAKGNLIRDQYGCVQAKAEAVPMKTVHFKYNYDLCPGTPNSEAVGQGRLTLEKVWFTYKGIEGKISPYEFHYQYATKAYPEKYKHFQGEFNFTPEKQNPSYEPHALDAWGNYQAKGGDRYYNLKSWLNQNPDPTYDIAAWQLKRIILPSKGEIHIQYEQDDYAYVQNQRAHVMCSIEGAGSSGAKDENSFYLNLDEYDSEVDREGLVNLLREIYVDNGERIYFKFLYKLFGASGVDLTDCNVEYIDGYARVEDVVLTADHRIKLVLRDKGGKRDTPYEMCKDLVKSQKAGMLSFEGNCDPDKVGVPNKGGARKVIESLANYASSKLVPQLICFERSNKLSYFRIPVVRRKLGGGLRVKRLLMYTESLDDTEPVLYGQEYIYKQNDPNGQNRIISSGVAVNEPQSIREENILVKALPRKEKNIVNRILSGEDKTESEGPIYEPYLPAASVGYAQVIVRNIHSGKTNPGFQINRFNTAREYPIKSTSTKIDRTQVYPIPAYLFVAVRIRNMIWAAQGHRIEMNDMHGAPLSMASYSGTYDTAPGWEDNPKSICYTLNGAKKISEQAYDYFNPGEKVKTTKGFGKEIKEEAIGKESEVIFAQRRMHDVTADMNFEADGSVGIAIIFPIPYASAFPFFSDIETGNNTHLTTTTVRYPKITRRVSTYNDGITKTVENTLFDTYTGSAVATLAEDEFRGAYMSYSVPASWEYPAFAPTYENEGFEMDNLNFAHDEAGDYLQLTGNSNCEAYDKLVPGDLLSLGNEWYYHVDGIDFTSSDPKIRVVRSRYSKNTKQPSGPVTARIVKSGKKNFLTAQAGSMLFHTQQDMFPDLRVKDPNSEEPKPERNYFPVIAESDRYRDQGSVGANAAGFAEELNKQIALIRAKTKDNSTASLKGDFTLTNRFVDMNMSSYIGEVPQYAHLDFTKVDVTQLKFNYTLRNGQLQLRLMSFTLFLDDKDNTSEVEVVISGDKELDGLNG